MGYPKYRNDPRWITVKYGKRCAGCGAQIVKGDSAFYYPKEKALYCATAACGEKEANNFEAAAMDEHVYNAGALA